MCIHRLTHHTLPFILSNTSYLRQCDTSFLTFILFIEGNILDCIVEFPRNALLYVQTALLLCEWMNIRDKKKVCASNFEGSLRTDVPATPRMIR
jgi:hypothetical protein